MCPEKAISRIPDQMSVIVCDPARDGIYFALSGLYVGAPMAVPVIRQLMKRAIPHGNILPGGLWLTDNIDGH